MKLMNLGLAATLGLTVLAAEARAAVVMDIFQSGGDVVATGSGTIDLTDLTFSQSTDFDGPGIIPFFAYDLVGPAVTYDLYGLVSGPPSFGGGVVGFPPSTVSGDSFGVIGGSSRLALPPGYISGASLSGAATYVGETIASMNLIPGKYVYTWGSGAHADSLTLDIVAAPEPSTWAMTLVGFVGIGIAYRATRRAGTAPSTAA